MKALGNAALVLALMAGAAGAQPSEPPPEGYTAGRYVDSSGCVFQRVTIGDRALWAALIGSDGQPSCGQEPTVRAGLSDALPVIPPNRRGTTPAFPEPGRYVQVGGFLRVTRADNTARQLQEAGLQVLRQDLRHRGQMMRVLYAGPLADGDTQQALRFVRSIGFGDAFVWTAD